MIWSISRTFPAAATSFGLGVISSAKQKLRLPDGVRGLTDTLIDVREGRSEAVRRPAGALEFVQDQNSEDALYDLLLRLTNPAASVEIAQ